MFRLYSTLFALVFTAFAFAAEPQIDKSAILRRGNVVERIAPRVNNSTAAVGRQSRELAALDPPADDSHKWFISVLTQPHCEPCKKLLANLTADERLRAFVNTTEPARSWSHYHVYSSADEAQRWRWKNISLRGYPTVLIQPPRNGKYGDPATVVLQKTGYDGDPRRLADQFRAAIQTYVKSLEEKSDVTSVKTVSTSRAEWAQLPSVPPNDSPLPPLPESPAVVPDAVVPDAVVPDAVDPDARPAVTPTPEKPAPPQPQPQPTPAPQPVPAAPFPQHPEAVVIVDKFADGLSDQGNWPRLRAVVQKLQSERPGLIVRLLDIRDAAAYPVRREELPAIVTTSEGRVETKLDKSLLPLLSTPENAFPWSALLSLFTAGFNWAGIAALAIWGVAAIRQLRKARGRQLLLDDDTVQQIRTLLQSLLNKPAA